MEAVRSLLVQTLTSIVRSIHSDKHGIMAGHTRIATDAQQREAREPGEGGKAPGEMT
jgi:hypothetical protein